MSVIRERRARTQHPLSRGMPSSARVGDAPPDDGGIATAPPTVAPTPLTMQRAPPKPICDTNDEAEKWAAEWWSDYQTKVKAHSAGLYFDPGELYNLLQPLSTQHPPVKLMRLSYLLKRAAKLRRAKTDEERRKLALPRRQWLEEHEPEAFLSADEVRKLGRGHKGEDGETCEWDTCGCDPCCCCPT